MNLRVFRRNQENIILLWCEELLNEDQQKNIKFFIKEGEDYRELKYTKSDSTQEFKTQKNTGIAIINQRENNIAPSLSFLLKAEVGSMERKEIYIRLSPAGVLPVLEKDQKKQHSQAHAWNNKKKKWSKIQLVQADNGSWGLPVVIVGNTSQKQEDPD
jgi:hypothetical protein